MGILERREREKSELRRRIMDAARHLFVEHGVEHASMRKIAEAIEYSPTAIYQHFPDKESLLRDICREDFAALHQAEAEAGSIDDPIERIRQIGMGYMRFGIGHPQQYRLMFMTRTHVQPTEEDLKRKGDPTQDGYAILQSNVRQALDQGRFRPEYTDLDLICQTLWAGVHGAVAIEITLHDDPWIQLAPFDQRANVVLDVLIRGMVREKSE
jgi:AcrR family transcriptional regulator